MDLPIKIVSFYSYGMLVYWRATPDHCSDYCYDSYSYSYDPAYNNAYVCLAPFRMKIMNMNDYDKPS